MKSLILKDLITFRGYLKTMILILVFFSIMTYSMDDVSFLSGMIILWLTMLPITSFSYDQHAKWDLFGHTLPVSRKQMVSSKYVLGLLFVGFATVIALTLNIVISLIKSINFDLLFLIEVNVAIGLVAIVFLSILFPLIYKFGVEKSRMFVFVILAIPSIIVILMSNAGLQLPTFDYITPELLLVGGIVVVAIVTMISYFVSLKIYLAKDF